MTQPLIDGLRAANEVLTADNWHTEAGVCAEAATLIERQQRVIEEARAGLIGELRAAYDAGRFAEWPTSELAAQCRMQAHDNLDPEYSQFMTSLADRLEMSPDAVR